MLAATHLTALFQFDNSFARLPETLWRPASAAAVANPHWLAFNAPLAQLLGLDPERLHSAEGLAVFAGNQRPHGAASIALAYAGHQFGHFVPQLGDGRALLLGEVLDPAGRRWDLQLKGSGPTAFSRRGDGRAAIGPVLREYLLGEAMHALGIPTTRALAAVGSGEMVWRETPLPGAILCRVASSHVRVGSFQYLAARADLPALAALRDHVINRHFPTLATLANPTLALLQAVLERQAALVAQWLLVGFIHGVMNTDNCSVCGETLDFGPCAFLDDYQPRKVYSAIDQQGRYAYANQPAIAQWNLARLAEALLPLIDPDEDRAIAQAQELLMGFEQLFQLHWRTGMNAKLGLLHEQEQDQQLRQDWLDALERDAVDYTVAHRLLGETLTDPAASAELHALFRESGALDGWMARWQQRQHLDSQTVQQRQQLMRTTNPALIARNHQVQAALLAAQAGDLAPFTQLLNVLQTPFAQTPQTLPYMAPPQPEQRVLRTFCGT